MNKIGCLGIGLVMAGVALLALVAFAIAYIGASNSANQMEQGIKAAHADSRNVLGQHAPKIKEALGVTKIQAGALEDIITGANTSRYGTDGSKAMTQFIVEQNPNLDQSNYARVITMIEAGRNDFQRAQTAKIDRLRAYDTARGSIPSGFFMRMAGYPTPEFVAAHYDRIVVSGHADGAFQTGIDDGVDLGK